jgi:hypothetical protein
VAEICEATFELPQLIIFSLEIRLGNGTNYQNNPLCNWISGFQDSKFKTVECQGVAKYATIASIGAKQPLTLCSVNVLSSGIQSSVLCSEEPTEEFHIIKGSCYLRTPKVLETGRYNINDIISYHYITFSMI